MKAAALLFAAVALASRNAFPSDTAVGSVGDALERQTIAARSPAHAMLLGAARAGERIVAVGERGVVIVSDDEAGHWKQVSAPVSVTLTAVRFADKDHGYAVGHGGTVLSTADGGQTWTRRLDGRQLAQVLLAAARHSGDAAAVKSAGRLVADGPDKPLLDLLVFDARRVLAVGAYGMAMFTQDGGATWASWRARLDNPKELHLYAVRQRGSRIVMAGEQGLVLQSLDGGQSFKRLAAPYGGSFFTVELPDERSIVVAGLRGNVWRTTDAGATWAQVASPVPVSITGSASGADGQLLFVNQAGMVLGLADGGLKPLNTGVLPPLNFILPLERSFTLGLSVQGALRVELPGAQDARKGHTQ